MPFNGYGELYDGPVGYLSSKLPDGTSTAGKRIKMNEYLIFWDFPLIGSNFHVGEPTFNLTKATLKATNLSNFGVRLKLSKENSVPLFPEHDPIVLRRIQRDQVQRQMFDGQQKGARDSLESNEESSSSSVGPNSLQHTTALDLKEVEATLGGRQLPNR